MTLYFFIAFFQWMSGHSMHDLHISVCEIEVDYQSKTLEISQRIFLDDLEQALILYSGRNDIDILQPKDKDALESLLRNYVLDNFQIHVNENTKKLAYLGSQIRGDVIVVYIEIPKIKQVNVIEIKNSVLMSLFPDQVTLVHIKKSGNTKSLKLDAYSPSGVIVWN